MDKQTQLDKERAKALGDVLVAECKSADYSLESIDTMLQNGADVNYGNSRPLYWATKLHRFDLVKYLIEHGALSTDIARTYISTICDYKGFSDDKEPEFFEILDLANSKTGDYMALFTPYINNMAVNGRLDKIYALMERYYLTEREIVSVIYVRIIFEIVNGGYADMLEFIEKHKNWMDKAAFDLCVSTGDWGVMEYFIEKTDFRIPSDTAVGQAVYEGYFEVLTILDKTGYDFSKKPMFLEKACRAAYGKGTKSLEFLLERGYSINDKYKGKTLLEHAEEDKNAPLVEFIRARTGN